MKLVQACSRGRNDLQSTFHHSGVPVKLLQPSLSVRKDLESNYHHCVTPVKLVQPCVCAGRLDKAVLTAMKVL